MFNAAETLDAAGARNNILTRTLARGVYYGAYTTARTVTKRRLRRSLKDPNSELNRAIEQIAKDLSTTE